VFRAIGFNASMDLDPIEPGLPPPSLIVLVYRSPLKGVNGLLHILEWIKTIIFRGVYCRATGNGCCLPCDISSRNYQRFFSPLLSFNRTVRSGLALLPILQIYLAPFIFHIGVEASHIFLRMFSIL
jgi:hypothetical protein